MFRAVPHGECDDDVAVEWYDYSVGTLPIWVGPNTYATICVSVMEIKAIMGLLIYYGKNYSEEK